MRPDDAASSLKLAFAESTLMDKSDMVTVLLADLRMLHVDVHIDEFGPGCSSLSYLRMLKANAVKIDRSVLAGTAGNLERTEALRSIVALAHELRLAVIAAGVESTEELTMLRELGCQFGAPPGLLVRRLRFPAGRRPANGESGFDVEGDPGHFDHELVADDLPATVGSPLMYDLTMRLP